MPSNDKLAAGAPPPAKMPRIEKSSSAVMLEHSSMSELKLDNEAKKLSAVSTTANRQKAPMPTSATIRRKFQQTSALSLAAQKSQTNPRQAPVPVQISALIRKPTTQRRKFQASTIV